MGKFVIGSSLDGYRYFIENFKGEVLAFSSFYKDKEETLKQIKNIKKIIANANIYDGTDDKLIKSTSQYFVINKDSDDMYRFTLTDNKDNVYLTSPAYTSFKYCLSMILATKKIVCGY